MHKIEIDYNEIFQSKEDGPYKIIEDLGYNDCGHNKMVKIKFLNTGYERIVKHHDAIRCLVRDKSLHQLNVVGNIYQSNADGPFKVIEDLGCKSNKAGHKMLRIKFLNTGYETIVEYNNAKRGTARDYSIHSLNLDNTYESKYYGQFKIIEDLGCINGDRKVKIKFLNTGYEKIVSAQKVLTGVIKDDSVPINERSIDPSAENYENFILEILKDKWKFMMNRCYNPKDHQYNDYGGIGITVCKRWHDKNNFLEDVKNLPNYDKFYHNPQMYQIDKDYLQQNIPREKRIYSPETCIFLSYIDNVNLSKIQNSPRNNLFGIKQIPSGNYSVSFRINGKAYTFGTYNNIVAAICDYNYYYERYGNYQSIPLLNNTPFIMSHEDAQLYATSINKNNDNLKIDPFIWW